MEEILRLMTSPGAGQVALGIALAWIIVNQHLLKACYKENREAAEKRSIENRKGFEQRADEDREAFKERANENRKAFEKCADEQRKAFEKRADEERKAFEQRAEEDREAARRYSAKNSAEHAEQLAALREIERKLDILLDRSNRPRTGSAAD